MTEDLYEKIANKHCPDCLAPHNEDFCDPRNMIGGMFHCAECGQMQLCGVAHILCQTCNGTGYIKELLPCTY
jgi:hypothetical protein